MSKTNLGNANRGGESMLQTPSEEGRKKLDSINVNRKHINNKKNGGKGQISVKIRLINVQGFTDIKYLELKENFLGKGKEYNIICLTETHQKVEKVCVGDGLFNHLMMRESNDKKGGGLQIMGINNDQVSLEKVEIPTGGIEIGCKDVMEVAGKCFGVGLRLVLVYFDVDKSRTGEGFCRNRRIQKMVESRIVTGRDEGLVLLGDFNAHLKILGAKDNDINGKMVLDWLEKYDLVLLNADEKCRGLFTWGRREQRSAIDLVLVNRKMYEICLKMSIDEEGAIINFSDHNLITLELNLRGGDLIRYRKGKWENGEFLKKDPASMGKMIQELKEVWVRGMGYENMWKDLLIVQDKVLKSTLESWGYSKY